MYICFVVIYSLCHEPLLYPYGILCCMTYLSVSLCFKLNCYVNYKGLLELCMLVLGLYVHELGLFLIVLDVG